MAGCGETGDSGRAQQVHDRTECAVCIWISRCAVGLLEERNADELTVALVLERAGVRRETFVAHLGDVRQALLTAYERVLDRMTARTARVLAHAPSFEAGLFEAIRQALAEMQGEPGLLRLHYQETARPGGGALLRARDAQRDLLVSMLAEARGDGPAPVEIEMLLGMMHTTLRQRMSTPDGLRDLEGAEHDVAPLLFQFVPHSAH